MVNGRYDLTNGFTNDLSVCNLDAYSFRKLLLWMLNLVIEYKLFIYIDLKELPHQQHCKYDPKNTKRIGNSISEADGRDFSPSGYLYKGLLSSSQSRSIGDRSRHDSNQHWHRNSGCKTVSYTHLTLPTKRIV